jgi:FtsZ-interacting cell division protein ZipA
MNNAELLRPLERVRARREDASLRALHTAAEATRVAQRAHEAAVQARRGIEHEIAETRARPFREPGAAMARVQASLRRVELLKDHLHKAREHERAAQAELETRRAQQAQALRAHLLAKAKHDSAQDQLQRNDRALTAQREHALQEATQELAAVRAAWGVRPSTR